MFAYFYSAVFKALAALELNRRDGILTPGLVQDQILLRFNNNLIIANFQGKVNW